MNFNELKNELMREIQDSYESGVTLDKAEKLAAKFLTAMLAASTELKNKDRDVKMRKAGLKAVKARAFLDTLRGETKLTEAGRVATVDTNELVNAEQDAFDSVEVDRDDLERVYNTFKEAHIHYRGISRGRFE